MQGSDEVPSRAASTGTGTSHPGLTLGVDVGGTKVLGVALDSSCSVVCQARAASPLSHHNALANGVDLPAASGLASPAGPAGTNRVIAAISEVVGQLMAETGSEPGTGQTPPLGVGVPGLVDDDGTMHFAPNLPAGEGVDFKAGMKAATGVHGVVIDNDATCAALGEWVLGAASGASDAIVITLGTGIGAGIISGGAVLRGVHGYAGRPATWSWIPPGRSAPVAGVDAGSVTRREAVWHAWRARLRLREGSRQ